METQNMLRTHEVKLVFSDKKIRFVTSLDPLTDQIAEVAYNVRTYF